MGDNIGPKQAPNSNNLRSNTITVTDPNGNKIQKPVLIDDQGNIVNEDDVEYVNENFIDEFGNQQTGHVPKIKDGSLKRMQNEAEEGQKEFSQLKNNKVLRDVDEYDEFGNKKTVQKLVDNIGPKQSPKSNNLRSSTITITDSNGNKIQKSVLIDDQGNIVNEDDVKYVNENFIDEFGNKQTRHVPKLKDESLKRM